MSKEEVISAMRHGSADPGKVRGPKDLGRFGLGLKTASFSQCRRLTVVSKVAGVCASAEWNLDEVQKSDKWFISILDENEIVSLPFFDSLDDTGTLIIWRNLDRLFEDVSGHKRDEIVNEKLAMVERHLSLVFHRFLSGEVKGRKKLAISINGHPVSPFDPFCRKNEATQELPKETVWVGEDKVVLQPYILPHHSRLTATEFAFYQDRSDFISNQGAYVYRNGRLMAWGDWFRMVPKGESTKLARVQIDFPNSLDEAWTIDIKKSRARPPHAVRERLGQIIDKIADRSVIVHRGRGQKLFQETQAPVWERYAEHGGIRFEINREHPLVTAFRSKLRPEDAKCLRVMLDAISAALPVEMIYSNYSTHPREFRPAVPDSSIAFERLRALKYALFDGQKGKADAFREIVQSTHLFDEQSEIVEDFIKESFS